MENIKFYRISGSPLYYNIFLTDENWIKHKLVNFHIVAKDESNIVVGYREPGKTDIRLNHLMIQGLVDYIISLNPHRQDPYLTYRNPMF